MFCQTVVERANTYQLMQGDEPFGYEPHTNLDESRPDRGWVGLICSDKMYRLAARVPLRGQGKQCMEPSQLVLVGRFLTRLDSPMLHHTRSELVYRLLSECILN